MIANREIIIISFTLAVILSSINFLVKETEAETVMWWGSNPAHLTPMYNDLYWSDASEAPVKKTPICGGKTVALAYKMGVPANIAIQGQNIFWIDRRSPESSILYKSALDGTSRTEIARGNNCDYGTDDIVVDETDIYWVNCAISTYEFFIYKIPVVGGDSTTLYTSEGYQHPIVALASDASHIYFAVDTYPNPEGHTSTIERIPKIGGQSEVLVSGLGNIRQAGLAIHDGELFFSEWNNYDTYILMKASISGGSVTTLATVMTNPNEPLNFVSAMAADNENLYWTDNNAVYAVPVVGGSITTLANVFDFPIDIAVNEGQIFWTEAIGSADGRFGSLKSVSVSGSEVTTLVEGGDAPRKLALSNDNVYWTEGGSYGLIEGYGRIAKISAGGGIITTVLSGVQSDSPPIATDGKYLYIADKWTIKKVSIYGINLQKLYGAYNEVADLATDGFNVYWIDQVSLVQKMPVTGGTATVLSSALAGPPGPIRVRKGYVYWIDHYDKINKVSVAGGKVTTLASDLSFLNDVAVDDTNVYFSEQDTWRIRRISINGGPIMTLVIPFTFPPYFLAVDNQNLYWLSQEEVGAIPKAGGNLTTIASDLLRDPFSNGSIAVDSTGVYWTETVAGEIMKQNFGSCNPPISRPSIAMPWLQLLLLDR